MNSFFNYLQAHYQYLLIGAGALVLTGAVKRWKWIVEPTVEDHNNVFISLILSLFGEHGFRVFMGICGAVLMLCGILFLVLR